MGRQRFILLLLLLLFPLFFFSASENSWPRSLKEVWNIGHVVFFFLLMVYLTSQCERKSSSKTLCLVMCGVICILTGVLVEFFQCTIPGRVFGVDDLWRDLIGIIIALVVVIIKARRDILLRITSLVVGCVFGLLAIFPLFSHVADERAAKIKFPMLSEFETKREISRWVGNVDTLTLTSEQVLQGRYSLKAHLTTRKHSGIFLKYFPGNWSGFQFLRFNIYNPGGELILHCRIHDKVYSQGPGYWNRYNDVITLHQGWNDIKVSLDDVRNGPAARELDLAEIRGFGIFVVDLEDEREVYLDNIRLE